MKKIILTAAAALACVGAFAQGKILFATDSLHLVYYDSTAGGLSGQAVTAANQPVSLIADLYMGTSSTSLSLYSSSSFSAVAPGKWNQVSVQAQSPLILGGTSVFVEVQVRDSAFAAPSTYVGTPFGTYYGTSQLFQFTLGSSVTYPAMYSAPTWAQGTQDLSSSAGAGARGAIAVSSLAITPEPGTMALAGLGAAAMMVFRRRKQ